MDTESKRLLKKIIKRIHPDLFGDSQAKKVANTGALAVRDQQKTIVSLTLHDCIGVRSDRRDILSKRQGQQ